ncbi:hypothetical protein [Aeromicrobium sp. UC242_57]|uniref:hypothetical protein n=1 Tax=Aeromicrobium sp. UC242_57 TaxID=3374624 RepID=UPI0037B12FD3
MRIANTPDITSSSAASGAASFSHDDLGDHDQSEDAVDRDGEEADRGDAALHLAQRNELFGGRPVIALGRHGVALS